MIINLAEVGTIFQVGKRENMEDYIFPLHNTASVNDRLFIVCDGMGGHTKGEVASKLACESFADYIFSSFQNTNTDKLLLDSFDHVQSVFEKYINENPDSNGMGTTLVLLFIHDKGITIMHCGDSRFYHFRNGKIEWMTSDHSLVNEWVQKGLITKEQAYGHPRANVITRAIQGTLSNKVKPDLHSIEDITENDYLLLCTDGLTNSLTDKELENIISIANSTNKKLEVITTVCESKSKDNYSAYLIKMGKIQNN